LRTLEAAEQQQLNGAVENANEKEEQRATREKNGERRQRKNECFDVWDEARDIITASTGHGVGCKEMRVNEGQRMEKKRQATARPTSFWPPDVAARTTIKWTPEGVLCRMQINHCLSYFALPCWS
jgi:hypothetical protein